MKLLATLVVLGVMYQTCQALLTIDEFIPPSWGANFQRSEYAKDPNNCKFGYRVNPVTRQVIDFFNCTKDNPDVFFSLQYTVCANEAGIKPYTAETCKFTPVIEDMDQTIVENDPNCLNSRLDVAPQMDNCARYLQCHKNNRRGSKGCGPGLYFSIVSYRCEFMWQVDDTTGKLVSLTEEYMCQTRTLPPYLRKNYGAIMNKCYWNWSPETADFFTYSVSEPLNCRFYYLCTQFNPNNVDTSLTLQCDDPQKYWSDSKQECVINSELTSAERTQCIVAA